MENISLDKDFGSPNDRSSISLFYQSNKLTVFQKYLKSAVLCLVLLVHVRMSFLSNTMRINQDYKILLIGYLIEKR